MTLSLIVAADLNNGIGKGGKLPWRLKGDMEHFKRTTLHHAVIMGRKTWESIPEKFRPLPQRYNVVLTRSPHQNKNIAVSSSLEGAIDQLKSKNYAQEEIFVIGGGEVYRSAIVRQDCKMIYLTRIKAIYECDTFFPDFSGFVEISSQKGGIENGVEYHFLTLQRP